MTGSHRINSIPLCRPWFNELTLVYGNLKGINGGMGDSNIRKIVPVGNHSIREVIVAYSGFWCLSAQLIPMSPRSED